MCFGGRKVSSRVSRFLAWKSVLELSKNFSWHHSFSWRQRDGGKLLWRSRFGEGKSGIQFWIWQVLKCLLEMASKELRIQICISVERAGLEIFYILSLEGSISSHETRWNYQGGVSVYKEEKRTTDSFMAHLITTASGEKSRDHQKRTSGSKPCKEKKSQMN